MPVWILVALIATGNPSNYVGDVLDVFGTKRDCLEAMVLQDPVMPLVCVEVK